MGARGPVSKKRKRPVAANGQNMTPLPTAADAIFRRLARDIDGVTRADVALIELMAYWLEIAKETRTQLAEKETAETLPLGGDLLRLTVTDTAHGNQEESRRNPLLMILRTASEQVRALAQQLGASPMARARLPEMEAEDVDIGAELFKLARQRKQAHE